MGGLKTQDQAKIEMALALEAAEPQPLSCEPELLGLLGELLPEESRDDVLRELRTAQVELHAVFASYSIDRTPAAEGAIVDAAAPNAKGLPLPAWHQLCADTGVDGLPEVEDAFLAFAPLESGDPSPCLAEPQFLAALVRLASSLSDEAQGLPKSLYTLLYECILPFARRDASSAFSKVLGSRSYLLPYLEEIRGSFSGFGARARTLPAAHYLAVHPPPSYAVPAFTSALPPAPPSGLTSSSKP